MSLYDELVTAAALDPTQAVIRIVTTLEPAGGADARVFPPTYPPGPDGVPYVVEPRRAGAEVRRAVLLDSVPSEANRVEEALLRAAHEQRIDIPSIVIEHGSDLVLSSLEVPHRYADAYLRDSTHNGTPFDKSAIGMAMLASTPADATALYQHDPGSLIFGAWNSHRKGRQAKFPRVYSSEIVGWDPETGRRKAGRMDPLNLQGSVVGTGDEWEYRAVQEKAGTRSKEKGSRLSEIGHGNIAPNEAHGGVTITSATRTATLSFAALDRLGFGGTPRGAALAARAALAAYALAGDRLAFGGGSVWLRSGCELVVLSETMSWVGRGGVENTLDLDTESALDLFAESRERCNAEGLQMSLEPVRLTPNKALGQAIDFSLTKAAGED